DDDEFEPEVQNLAPPPAVEDVVPTVEAPKGPGKPKPKYMQKEKAFNMEDLGRELTPKEREDIQRRNELIFAREMFGGGDDEDDDQNAWDKVMTKEEFEMWGEKAGKFFTTRHKAGHYGDFLSKLLSTIAGPLDANEVRKMSNLLKTMADDKKTAADKEKKAPGGAKGAAKGKAKPSLKGGKSGGGSMYDDYEGGGGKHDDYDDFM
ncbi:hypothetical protein PFISCL1PPCAC_19561, partial [Pristionchus fissidentatus]